MAQLWHFLGRFGVPIVYAWPAGRGGLRGYATDRESGEFTVFHLKQFLRAIADCPDVERVHIIAHSRGSDVILTALRELTEYYKGTGQRPGEALKLGNLILAAPDIDWQVFAERVAAEQLLAVAERTTIYLSPDDKAIRLATILFDSGRRLGQLFVSDLSNRQRDVLRDLRNLAVVDARIQQGDFLGHGYFYANRAVSSDLILVLRDGRDPGAENGRPLELEESVFWRIRDDYLLED
jgi:esterase/lipase superfamily enzyme